MHRPARLVLASNNPGKLRELSALLAPLGIELLAQSSLGVGEAEEPHVTFIENALAKARHASRASGLPALADDSGLCVDALDGGPGVRSARLAGERASDEENNRRLLDLLDGSEDRQAHYYCVLVLVRAPEDPQPLIAEGEWAGEILRAPRGAGGFGYDPLFWLPGLGCSSAELPAERKNELSHRFRAASALAQRLRRIG
ncbi:MAG: RdgB/HAM1 family non-canonical purine NTP pyrophosphatase [Rhodocyclaceae bacterium]